ncbi:protein LATERAL ROOT PRIMORDIUM 1 [Magnolia sinica]|uniref:protein LATERAL ROOT PRIMORDIUM 1 n=1 Tax=Magnolia sinica TaxID=86752 RepID=UPI0026589395|nr:protein LATERAL ROOT PRIMORDIUM 1 [Magnolia sinica]
MGMVGHLRDVFVVAPASFHSQQQHHHHNHEQFLSEQAAALHSNANAHAHAHAHAPHNNAATALGVGVIPLLTTAPCLAEDLDAAPTRRIGGVHLWQNPMQAHPNYMKKPVNDASGSDANADILNVNNSGSGIGIGTTTCQDCGNQAKKDCSHRRCRTCCKSRGFDCSTHVKSTWVPAARRRERQLSAATAAAAAVGSTASTSAVKKPRLISSQTLTSASHTSTSNTTPPRSFDTSSSHQDASFRENLPGHVRAPAVFKCVRVTAVDNGEDEYAYQAVVKIGGHIFKGFLYDQGVEGRDGLPNISDLHLGGPGGGRNEASSSLFPVLDPSDVYAAASGGGMLGGTAYGNPIN